MHQARLDAVGSLVEFLVAVNENRNAPAFPHNAVSMPFRGVDLEAVLRPVSQENSALLKVDPTARADRAAVDVRFLDLQFRLDFNTAIGACAG